jgi:hypothetical protein
MTTETKQPPNLQDKQDHSAELQGDKVILRHDFVRRRLMADQGTKLLLTDTMGREARIAFPEWYFCWASQEDIPERKRNGFEIVDPKTMPNLVAPGQTEEDKKEQPTRITVNELTLMRLPMAEHLEFVRLHDLERNRRKEADLEDEADKRVRDESHGIMAGASREGGGITITRGQ